MIILLLLRILRDKLYLLFANMQVTRLRFIEDARTSLRSRDVGIGLVVSEQNPRIILPRLPSCHTHCAVPPTQ